MRAELPITVLGGALGAGKTTLLNALLRRGGRRIGVVVNDFGELGVDAELVRSTAPGVDVVNLANGCVCCTLGGDLRETLDVLAAVDPPLDHILVEASGVADPAATAAWGTVPPFVPGGTIVLAAADSIRRSAGDRYVGAEIRRQLDGADLVLVTKGDLVANSELDAVDEWLSLRTGAPVHHVTMGEVEPDVVLGVSTRSPGPVTTDHPPASDVYLRWAWQPTTVVAESGLQRFLAELPAGVLRVKGVVDVAVDSAHRRCVVQVVGRRIDLHEARGERPVGLEVIGVRGELDRLDLDHLAANYLLAP